MHRLKMLHTIQPQSKNTYNKVQTCKQPQMGPIAPALEKRYTVESQTDFRRYTNKSNPYIGAQAASIARRNARERNRVKQVNDGFNALRKRLPATVVAALSGGPRRGSGKKLSKVDTLRMVVEYIRYLQGIIEESDLASGKVREKKSQSSYENDEGVFSVSSPYSEPMPSPAGSECSSGGSSAYSNNNFYQNYQANAHKLSPMEDYELLDAISWWQDK